MLKEMTESTYVVVGVSCQKLGCPCCCGHNPYRCPLNYLPRGAYESSTFAGISRAMYLFIVSNRSHSRTVHFGCPSHTARLFCLGVRFGVFCFFFFLFSLCLSFF